LALYLNFTSVFTTSPLRRRYGSRLASASAGNGFSKREHVLDRIRSRRILSFGRLRFFKGPFFREMPFTPARRKRT
jgi:hypothetical protein